MVSVELSAAGRIEGCMPRPENTSEATTDPVERLLAQSAERRQQQATQPQRFTGSWYDPDPQAILALPVSRHPITGYIARTRGSDHHRRKQKFIIRTVLAVLVDSRHANVTWDQVLAYPWHHVGPDEAQDAYRGLVAMYPNLNTRHNFVQMLRSIMKGFRDAKLISHVRYLEIVEELPTTSKRGVSSRRRRLSAQELSLLMRAARDQMPLRAARDAAVIAVFATTGIRVSELVGLDLGDWNQHEQILTLAITKNGRPHAVPVDPRTAGYLSAWLEYRGTTDGPLFVGTGQPSTMPMLLPRLSTDAVRERILRIAERADIGRLGTHDFRRTVATTLLRTTDAALVGRLLGHSSLAATLVYDMASEDEQRAAIATLPLPDTLADTSAETTRRAS